jgi:predicted amidohydrolase YtcJ
MKLFTNARIISPSLEIPEKFNAIAVEDGKIVAIDEAKSLIPKAKEIIDLEGQVLLPGFIDPHAHPLMYGQMMDWIDVGPAKAKSIEEIVQILLKVDRELPANQPIRAFGYEHRNLIEGRHPNRNDLDRVSTTREIYVMNASGHGGAVNSLILTKNEITEKTPDPRGGSFERDGSGSPTGVIWDAACDVLTGANGVKVGNHGPNFHLPDSQEILTNQFLQAQDNFIGYGVTSIGDAQVSKREFDTYLDAKNKNKLKSRYSLYLISSLLENVVALRSNLNIDEKILTADGIKMYADGTLGGWTAYFPEGYLADRNRKGQLYHDQAEFTKIFLASARKGFHIATHAQSPTAIGMVINSVKQMRQESIKKPDGSYPISRVEHCGLPELTQIKEMASLGMIAVSQPIHHHNWGDGVVTAVGKQVGERFNPLGEFEKHNLDFALSSDAPVGKPNPFEAISAAVKRLTVHGTELGSTDLKISTRTALIAHTLGGAKALGKEKLVGSLEVGKFADFVLVEENPLQVSQDELGSLKVKETYLSGDRVFRA